MLHKNASQHRGYVVLYGIVVYCTKRTMINRLSLYHSTGFVGVSYNVLVLLSP